MDYDILVIAVGAKPNTFNTPGVEEHAHFLKEADDALKTVTQSSTVSRERLFLI